MSLSRRDFIGAALATAAIPRAARAVLARPAALSRPRPTASQLAWQRDEFSIFCHFGVNTFTDREWGDGTESPSIFAPSALDVRQWARAARRGGAKAMILTAKHHDGFCLWPTATTTHSVASSPLRGGSGDVVREFVDACRAEGLKPGLYLSPWDRNHPAYGDSARYNDVYIAQLTELLTRYGPIHEVWFDGANGEGPNGKRQTYDWSRTWGLVRRLQPNAVMFSDAGPDVRWIGNERGVAGTTNWSMVRPELVPAPGTEGDEAMRSMQQGDRDGTVWRPGETDVSIRPGWFWHAAEDAKVRSTDNLVDLYFTSVGRNSKLLLNVPPTREGLFADSDVRALAAMRDRLDGILAPDLANRARTAWRLASATTAVAELRFDSPSPVAIVDLRENIAEGQRVAAFTLEAHDGAQWSVVLEGTTIGYRRLERIAPGRYTALRLTVRDAVEPPRPISIAAYDGA